MLASISYHIGRHTYDIPTVDYENIALIMWISELAFLVCGGCTKISVLLFYRRLVKGTYNKYWRWAVLVAMTFTAAWTLAFILALCFNCRPTNAYWKSFDPTYTKEYTCVRTVAINLLAGIMAIISDVYSIALPILMARELGLSARQKLALNIIVSLGFLVIASSVVRTYYLWGRLPSCVCEWCWLTRVQRLVNVQMSAGISTVSSSVRNSNYRLAFFAPAYPHFVSSSEDT